MSFLSLSIILHAGLVASLVALPRRTPATTTLEVPVELVIDVADIGRSDRPEAGTAPEPIEAVGQPSETAVRPDTAAEPVSPASPQQTNQNTPESHVSEPTGEATAPASASTVVGAADDMPADETAGVAPPTPAEEQPEANRTTPTPTAPAPTVHAETAPQPAATPPTEQPAEPTAETPTPPATAEEAARPATTSKETERYFRLIADRLARAKQFPQSARGKHRSGSALVRFSVTADGRVEAVDLVRSSGHSSLDLESQEMVRRASPFPPPPDGKSVSFTLPVVFHGS